jgi:hypothetical protein
MKSKKIVFYSMEDLIVGIALLQSVGKDMGWMGKLCAKYPDEKVLLELEENNCIDIPSVLDECPQLLEYIRQKGCDEIVYLAEHEEGNFYQHYWL